jgi:lysophospholipase L1-like esterase
VSDGPASRPESRWTAGPLRSAAVVGLLLVAVVLVVGGLRARDDDDGAPRPGSRAGSGQTLQLVALGDSLSRGVQPGERGQRITGEGYPRQLATLLRRRGVPVELVEAGCGGATAASALVGGRCAPTGPVPYANDAPATSQVAWAVRHVRSRDAAPTLVTLDLGSNDVLRCVSPDAARVRACLRATGPGLRRRLREIAQRIAAAAGPDTVLVAATVYDPFVALLRGGALDTAGLRAAVAAVDRFVVRELNPAIRRTFTAQGWLVAEVGPAMGTDGTRGPADVDRVDAICDLTWMCARADVHLNREGYLRAARVFERTARRSVEALRLTTR